jgi:hypothetical protein
MDVPTNRLTVTAADHSHVDEGRPMSFVGRDGLETRDVV